MNYFIGFELCALVTGIFILYFSIVKANRKIILFTNFSAKAGESNVVGNALEQEGIELIVM